jgi:hypothetical protein
MRRPAPYSFVGSFPGVDQQQCRRNSAPFQVAAVERRMIEPRGMSKEQAAAYAGCESLSAFNDWIRRGIIPGPIPGTRKWDRKAIDAALDQLTGLQRRIEVQSSPYDAWKACQNASAAEGNQLVDKKAR